LMTVRYGDGRWHFEVEVESHIDADTTFCTHQTLFAPADVTSGIFSGAK
jgi:hypothetical protein